MEYCIEARALKPSLRREIDVRSDQNQAAPAVAAAVEDEFVYESEAYGGGLVEDFLIEDLLDFPEKEDDEETEKESVSECTIELETDDNGNSMVSDEFLSFADDAAGLAVPDDLADLEWVSRFVDDSLPEFPPLYPSRKDYSGVSSLSSAGAGSLPVQFKPVCIKPLIAAKPRTKRQRIGRVWSVSSTTASESSTITSSTHSSSSIISNPVQFGFSKPASKKQKTKPNSVQLGDSTGSQRRCSHCQVQKTPQWRAGPEGSKTLCNACGVRFKSGRLYPEYRPACSPTFRAHLHSSSHRKVLEMRKKKDVCSSGLSV